MCILLHDWAITGKWITESPTERLFVLNLCFKPNLIYTQSQFCFSIPLLSLKFLVLAKRAQYNYGDISSDCPLSHSSFLPLTLTTT